MRQKYKIPPPANQKSLPIESVNYFDEWAKKYFIKSRRNAFITYREALDNFRSNTPQKNYPQLKFKYALTAWCSKKGYILNPSEFQNAAGRIIRRTEVAFGKTKIAEMFYIKK